MDSQQGYITTVVVQDTRSGRRYEIKEIFFSLEHLNARRDRHYLDETYHTYLQPSTINIRRLSPTKSQPMAQHTKLWPNDNLCMRAVIKKEMESSGVDYRSAFTAENAAKTFRIIFSNLPSCQNALHPHAQRRAINTRSGPRKQLPRSSPLRQVQSSCDSANSGVSRGGGSPRMYRSA